MKLPVVILSVFVATSLIAEEKMNALQTALSSTTISGYVDTSIEWTDNDYSVPMTHPQVPASGQVAPPNWGADAQHYFVRASFVRSNDFSRANGTAEIMVQRLGALDRRQCLLRVRQLAPLKIHTLLAARVGDADWVTVAQFKSDARGAAALLYKNGPVSGVAAALPETLDCLPRVIRFAIADAEGRRLLTANLSQPDQLQHFARKRMTSFYGVGGQTHVYSARKHSVLRLEAMNLMPEDVYLLALNTVVVGETRSDERGQLRLAGVLQSGATPVYLQSVEVGGTNLVGLLRADFP